MSFKPNLAACEIAWLGEEHAEAICSIEQEMHPFSWSKQHILSCFTAEYPILGLKIPDSGWVAFLVVMPVEQELHILNLVVKQLVRRQGLAKQLLNAALRWARENGFKSALLEVRVTNEAAIALYHQFGFVQIGVRRGYYPCQGDQREDAFVMKKIWEN